MSNLSRAERARLIRDLAKRRQDLGYKQAGLAELAGLARETITRIESGDRMPSDHTLERMARALGFPMPWESEGDDVPIWSVGAHYENGTTGFWTCISLTEVRAVHDDCAPSRIVTLWNPTVGEAVAAKAGDKRFRSMRRLSGRISP